MAKNNLRRQSSIPSYLVTETNAVEVEESDLRWRRSSTAAISAMLPSHSAYHSEMGLTLARSMTAPQRRKSIMNRRKSVAAVKDIVNQRALQQTSSTSSTIRQLIKGISVVDAWVVGSEERERTIESIRSMTATIGVKRKYRDQVLTKEPNKLEGWEYRKYQIKNQYGQFKSWLKNIIYQLELWSGAFKIIEGHHGTSTLSYFRFLRWMMFLNLFLTIIMMSVVLIPFLVIPVPKGTTNTFEASVNASSSVYACQAKNLSKRYEMSIEKHTAPGDIAQDVLQGTGILENTVLFIGYYRNRTISTSGDITVYNMSVIYLCALGAGYVLSFILLVKNSAKGMKQSLMTSASGSLTMYCNKVFGAWDYAISQEKTATLKYKTVYQDFKNELEYQRLQWKKASRTTKEKAKLYSIRFLVNILVVAVLGAALYAIYFSNQKLVELTQACEYSSVVMLLLQFLPSITITLLSVIVPLVFNKVVIAEDYMPAFAMRITLFRTVLLRLSSLGILVLSLYTSITSQNEKEPDTGCRLPPQAIIETTIGPTTTVATTTPASNNNTTNSACENNRNFLLCWETYVGQQIYKLVFLNFLVVVGVTFLWEYPRKLLVKKFQEKVKLINMLGQQTFDLSKCVLDLVYLQTLCWLGMFFSPIIPAMCLFTCFIFFYVKKNSLLHNCLPVQRYGTSKSNSLFMMVLLLSFFLCSLPVIVMISKKFVTPSKGCGPFRVHSSDDFVIFDVISNLVHGWPEVVSQIFKWASSTVAMVTVGLLLSMLMYYFHIVGQAHYKMAKQLREQLKIEGQDKQFLVARVNEAMEREQDEQY